MTSITIVIPAYNEEQRIGKILKIVSEYLRNNHYDYEIIVVNDGSVDSTTAVVNSFGDPKITLVGYSKNRGKGFAVKTGVLAAQKDWILLSDADCSTPIEELEKLLHYHNYEIIIGSRGLPDSQVSNQRRYRQWGGRFFNILVRLLVLPGFKDTQCGFKLFKRDVAQRIFQLQTIEQFGFDVEILYIARKHGYSIQEVPVRWYNDRVTKVHFLKDALRMSADLVKIRLNDSRGVYDT